MSDLIPVIDKNQIRAIFERRDIATRTIDEYTRLIEDFLVFMGGKQLHKGTLNEYKRHLKERTDIGKAFKAKKLNAAKVFLEELVGKDKITVRGFKQTRGHKKEGINDAEMLKIAKYLKELEPSKETMRLKALVALMYFQGFREVEINRLSVEDIDFANMTAMIQGKSEDDTELVHLHPSTVKIIKTYLGYVGIKSGALFTSFSTNGTYGHRLTERNIRRVVSNMLAECGIDKVPHGFRHYFTTRLLNRFNGNLAKVRRFTRHTDFRMLIVYDDSRVHKEDLKEYYQAFGNI